MADISGFRFQNEERVSMIHIKIIKILDQSFF
jgi:hypothetical protein